MHRSILHVDMDAFYAAVEERENPTLRGRPVIIGADPRRGSGRGVVSTANYAARRFGVHSAMPISQAYALCPDAEFVKPRMSLYAEVSRRVMGVLKQVTDLIEPISIDEAFLDVSGSRRLLGSAPMIAKHIKGEILRLESLTASVGCATSKFVAKVASDVDKPDGLVIVAAGSEAAWLAPLPLERLWGAGPKAIQRFRSIGCATFGDVAALTEERLSASFGPGMGRRFHRLSRGIDDRPVDRDRQRKSLGKETTFRQDVSDRRRVERRILSLCEEVVAALRRKGLAGRTVTTKLRWEGFETVTRQRSLASPADTMEAIWPVARDLFHAADRPDRPIRLVGVSLSGLQRAGEQQLQMFEPLESRRDSRVASALDSLSERFGSRTVTRAALLDENT